MHRFRLTPMQEGMLFEAQDDRIRYVSTLRCALKVPMNQADLDRRLAALVRRHEALRTHIVCDEAGTFWQEVTDQDAAHFRVALMGKEVLSVSFAHWMLDGWSVGILLGELTAECAPDGVAAPFRHYAKWRQSRTGDAAWWPAYLGDSILPTPLPNARKPDGYQRREWSFCLDDTALIAQRAKALGLTAGRLVQAVWNLLMARYHGGNAVVCTVNAGRSAPVPGLLGMVGMCVNTLPIVTKLPEPPECVPFSDWVRDWNRQTASAEKHGNCTLADLIQGDMPHLLAIEPSFDGAGHRIIDSDARLVTDFDVVVTLGTPIAVTFAYNACAHAQSAVESVQGHFLTALAAVLSDPDIGVEQIPILTRAEQIALTDIRDDARLLDLIDRKTVCDLVCECAAQRPDRCALVFGDVRLTYAQLMEMAWRMAAALRARGIGAEMPVAILLSRSHRYVIAELAVWLCGGCFVPLDVQWPQGRVEEILREINPCIVVDETTYAALQEDRAQFGTQPMASPQETAYIIMTSATTGAPKGVVVAHRNFANFCLWAQERYEVKPSDATALVLGFAFDGAMWDIWLPLISGATVHVLADDIRYDIAALGAYCRAERITHIDLPVALCDGFREAFGHAQALPDLRVMVTGGEAVRRVVPASCPLSNEYGPTECTVCCSAGWIRDGADGITVGSPTKNMHAYILDAWDRLCPDGVAGQAHFSGAQVARGYYHAASLTAQRFVDNPFAADNPNHRTLYRTGDQMVRTQQGSKPVLSFVGRMDRQVKLSGFRVELGEVERVVSAHPAVTAALAFVQNDRLYAYAVTGGRDASGLDNHIAESLPAFMRPVVRTVSHMPLTTSGKVDFSGFPAPGEQIRDAVVAPVTDAQRALVSCVAETLGIEGVGIHHAYPALGGNSINAMKITFALSRKGWSLGARTLITSIDLATAAHAMRPVAGARAQAVQAVFVPRPAQLAMIFLAETEGAQLYTVTATRTANGLCAHTLRQRLDRAAALHDMLRTVFERDERGEIVGRVSDATQIPLYTDAAAGDGMHPLRGPLVTATLANDALTLRYHHILLDGHSIGLLWDELLHGHFPESAPSFAAFANRQAEQIASQTRDEHWWRAHDAEAVSLFAHRRGQVSDCVRTEFCSPALFDKCCVAARRAGVTVASFLLTAWGVVLDGHHGTEGAFWIPFVASDRDDDGLMGMCASTRPLAFDRAEGSFSALARRVQETMLDSIEHPFVPQDITASLPRHLFVFEDAQDGAHVAGQQDYDLVVKCANRGELIYNPQCLCAQQAHRLCAQLTDALEAALEDRVSTLSHDAHALVAETFAHGATLCVPQATAAQAFAAAARRYPERIALETESETLSYAQLYVQAQAHADALAGRGLGAGDVCAFCPTRDANGIVELLGIALSGAAFCPLDPAWPDARRADILRELDGQKVPPDTAYVLYTSGTTGRPKGVIVSQGALSNQIAWAQDAFPFAPEDKMLHYVAFTFDPSVWTIFTTLCAGAALYLLPEHARIDPAAAAQAIAAHGITLCVLPAAVGAEILRRAPSTGLRLSFLGGESPRDLPQRSDGLVVVNCYGPTEICVNATCYPMPPDETSTRNIGRPVANTRCYVLDARKNPVTVGVSGMLYIGGVQLAHGYLNRPDETAAAFIEHPTFGRLYKTGDRAAWNDDGTLTFLGRTDGQVKIRGNRVELGEIERALCALPGIADAKVLLQGDAMHAYVVAHKPIEPHGIRQSLSAHLPSYMVPQTVTAVEAFALTGNGKVDISALPCAQRAQGEAPAQTKTEQTIAKAWRIVLDLPADCVIGRTDRFADLGGHSLKLFHVVGQLAKLGMTVDIRMLAEHPVLADLAHAHDHGMRADVRKPTVAASANDDAYARHVQAVKHLDLRARRVFQSVLITGGTGFLGSYLVREFYEHTDAVLLLPVRGDVTRLRDALVYYFGDRGKAMAASARVQCFSADIAQAPPAVDGPLTAIYHTAADIRHYAPEADMIRANVTATEHMLACAAQHPDCLFAHVSTTSAVNAPIIRETDIDTGPRFDNVYQRTKQMAERRVGEAAGVPHAIFRVGHVSPSFDGASAPRNSEINAMLRLTNAMLLTELLPEQDYRIGYGFVDYVAHAIRLLTEPVSLTGGIFHIDNPNTVRLSEIFRLGGLPVEMYPRDELARRLRTRSETGEAAVRDAALEYLGRLEQGSLEKDESDVVAGDVRMEATLAALHRLDFRWPHVTQDFIKRVIADLQNNASESR